MASKVTLSRNQQRLRVAIAMFIVVPVVLFIVLTPQHHPAVPHILDDPVGALLHKSAAAELPTTTTLPRSTQRGALDPGTHGASDSPQRPQRALLHTNFGEIGFLLDWASAPLTVTNFVRNARTGLYNSSCFYRYEANFVLQGGLHCVAKMRSSSAFVPLEYKRPNSRLTVGLARAASPNSGSTEFFINLADNSQALSDASGSGGYAVFASVESGLDVMARMQELPTKREGLTMFKAPQPKIYSIEIMP